MECCDTEHRITLCEINSIKTDNIDGYIINVVIFSDATFKVTVKLTGFTATTESVINRNYTVENQTVQGIHIRPKVKENFFVFAAIGVAVIAFFLFVMLLYFRFVQRKNQNPNPVAVDFW